MATVHIGAEKGDIAKKVLMPGDPNRAFHIAKTYLTDARLVNKVRGALAYTGKYKGVEVTIFTSGMGIPSMGIYSYELFHDYDVEEIIRIGTAGSYRDDLNIFDILLATSAYSLSAFDTESTRENIEVINSSTDLNAKIIDTALMKGVKLREGRVHTSDAFYTDNFDVTPLLNLDCLAVEMETYALLFNAKRLMKKATSILTISDKVLTHEAIDSEAREKKVDEMVVLALEAIIK